VTEAKFMEIAGSGPIRIATRSDLKRREREQLAKRDVAPLEGTQMSLWNSVIPNWWDQNINQSFLFGDPTLADRVWVANRCQQLNSQQIASMPLVYHGNDEPAWVSSPDPHWYPNGLGDALHAIVDQLYGWGFSCQYVTDTYATGFPRTFTVLPSAAVQIKMVDGSRTYKIGDEDLDASRILQIDRNPGTGLHGCSALRAYAQMAWGLLAAGNQSMSVTQGGIPQAVIKSARKLTPDQAEAIQTQWMTATQRRSGAPPVLPPELDFDVLSINPSDLSLLETQEWDARVIATAYGVPAVLLNMSLQGGLTYQNPAALGEMWWRFELRTTATRIANAFSAQMLPRGQWVSFDAADTFAAIDQLSDDDDEQLSQVAKASPAQQPRPLTAIGGGG
jgi:HK97 family phage portal protein